jgi:hypothetical protein
VHIGSRCRPHGDAVQRLASGGIERALPRIVGFELGERLADLRERDGRIRPALGAREPGRQRVHGDGRSAVDARRDRHEVPFRVERVLQIAGARAHVADLRPVLTANRRACLRQEAFELLATR